MRIKYLMFFSFIFVPWLSWAEEKQIESVRIEQLLVDVEKSIVRIEGSGDGNIFISADRLEDSVRSQEGSLIVTDRDNSGKRRYLGPILHIRLPSSIRVSVKTASGDIGLRSLASDLQVATASGDIEVIDCLGQISISGVSGDVVLRQARQDLQIQTVSGDIRAGAITSPLVEIQSVSGDIILEQVSSPRLRLRTVSGDIRLKTTPPVQASLMASTVSGDVGLWLGEQPGFELVFATMSGDVNFEFKNAILEREKRRVLLFFGDRSLQIKISTVSGDLNLYRLP